MKNIRIRGMFASALTKLSQDFGFNIVDPSSVLIERLNLEKDFRAHQIELKDNEKRGISISGKPELIREFLNKIKENVEDIIVRESNIEHNAIYKGKVLQIDYDKRALLMDLGHFTGFLPFSNTKERLKVADEAIVQIKNIPFSKKMPLISMYYTVSDEYASVLPFEDKIIVDNKIEVEKKVNLLNLAKKKKGIGNGFVWKTPAISLNSEQLIDEIENIRDKFGRVKNSKVKAPAKLLDGKKYVEIDFSHRSKQKFDKIRKKIMKTLDGHHKYKSGTDDISLLVDVMETFTDIIKDEKKLIEKFKESLKIVKGPRVGQKFFLEHLKINGSKFKLNGIVKKINDEKIVIYREMQTPGIYDGLNSPKERGDYALTTIEEGMWHYKNEYFSADGKLKGKYVNINTPIEIYPDRARYIDLEVDIVKSPEKDPELRDEKHLKRAYDLGMITEELFKESMAIAKKLQSKL